MPVNKLTSASVAVEWTESILNRAPHTEHLVAHVEFVVQLLLVIYRRAAAKYKNMKNVHGKSSSLCLADPAPLAQPNIWSKNLSSMARAYFGRRFANYAWWIHKKWKSDENFPRRVQSGGRDWRQFSKWNCPSDCLIVPIRMSLKAFLLHVPLLPCRRETKR